MIITILWEDQLGVQQREFGPHNLLLKCVEDRLSGWTRQKLKDQVIGAPKKGNGTVVNEMKRLTTAASSSSARGPVLGVLDWDKAPRLLKLNADTCFSHARDTLASQGIERRSAVFLVRNVETLLQEACLSLGSQPPPGKPNPNKRDAILNRLVWDRDARKRDEVRARIDSFNYLLTRVEELLLSGAPR